MQDLSSDDLLEFCRTNVSTCFSLATEAAEGVRKVAGLNRQADRNIIRGIWNL